MADWKDKARVIRDVNFTSAVSREDKLALAASLLKAEANLLHKQANGEFYGDPFECAKEAIGSAMLCLLELADSYGVDPDEMAERLISRIRAESPLANSALRQIELEGYPKPQMKALVGSFQAVVVFDEPDDYWAVIRQSAYISDEVDHDADRRESSS